MALDQPYLVHRLFLLLNRALLLEHSRETDEDKGEYDEKYG